MLLCSLPSCYVVYVVLSSLPIQKGIFLSGKYDEKKMHKDLLWREDFVNFGCIFIDKARYLEDVFKWLHQFGPVLAPSHSYYDWQPNILNYITENFLATYSVKYSPWRSVRHWSSCRSIMSTNQYDITYPKTRAMLLYTSQSVLVYRPHEPLEFFRVQLADNIGSLCGNFLSLQLHTACYLQEICLCDIRALQYISDLCHNRIKVLWLFSSHILGPRISFTDAVHRCCIRNVC